MVNFIPICTSRLPFPSLTLKKSATAMLMKYFEKEMIYNNSYTFKDNHLESSDVAN